MSRRMLNFASRRTLPVKVGRIAKDHFQEGFRQGGFQDNATQPWQRKKHPDKYGPLMSSRQNLYGSIYYHPDDYRVTVGTSVPYAGIHNEGGEIVVTPRMKRFFWAKYRETNGGSWKRNAKNEEAELKYSLKFEYRAIYGDIISSKCISFTGNKHRNLLNKQR